MRPPLLLPQNSTTLSPMQTLVLDTNYNPHRVVGWQKAVSLLHKGRAEVVHYEGVVGLYDEILRTVYQEVGRRLATNPQTLAWFELGAVGDKFIVRAPAVIRLFNKIGRKKIVKFSRINVLTRDEFKCCYCGKRKTSSELNYDHVLPRSQGGKTTWENIVMSCYECNSRKADRTPVQAGMTLLRPPVKPKSLPIAALRLDQLQEIPDCWRSWLYWTAELEP